MAPAARVTSRAFEPLLRWLTRSALRSTAAFVVLTFVPLLLLTYYIVAGSIRGTRSDADASDRQLRDLAADVLNANFRAEREALLGAADESALARALQAPPLRPGRPNPAQPNLAHLLRRRPEFAWVALYNDAGNALTADPAGAAPVLAANAPLPAWLRTAVAGTPAVSAALTAPAGAPPQLVLAVPTGVPAAPGVLVAALPVSVIAGWLRRIQPGPQRSLYLVDAARQLLTASPAAPLSSAQIGALPETAAALARHAGVGETRISLTPLAIAFEPLSDENLAVLVVRPVRFGFYLYRVLYDKLALIALIVFALAVASGLLVRAAFRYYERYNREVETGRSKTEALLGSIGDGVFAVDVAGRIIEFNRAAAALAQQPAAATLGRVYTDVIRLADERLGGPSLDGNDPIQRAMRENRTLRYVRDLELLRSDGSRVPVTLTAAPVRDEQGAAQGCIVVLSDASQEREVDRMKTEFISIASHQLRTPMSGVKGALALLDEEVLGPLNREQHEYVSRAYESNERLIALVNDLLNVSRLEQGQMQLRQEPLNLAAMLPALMADYQPRARRYRQDLSYAAPPAAEVVVMGDAVRLREVFANLLDNAIKYTPEQGRIVLRLKSEPDFAVVEVSDSGVGIPADKIPTLFQKFTRIQNPLSGREAGTGLGLYFVRSMVELHRGKIEVISQPEVGSTFRVSLPRVAEARNSSADAKSPSTPI